MIGITYMLINVRISLGWALSPGNRAYFSDPNSDSSSRSILCCGMKKLHMLAMITTHIFFHYKDDAHKQERPSIQIHLAQIYVTKII